MCNVKMLSVTAVFFIFATGSTAFAEKTAAIEAPAAAIAKNIEPSIFDQIGGDKLIDAAVDKFYDKVLMDKRVNSFFKGIDMNRLRAMQKGFFTVSFSGPDACQGRDLRTAHAYLVARGLNDTHFDIIIEHLGATLKEMKVKDELIAHADKIANSFRNDVLNKQHRLKGQDIDKECFPLMSQAEEY